MTSLTKLDNGDYVNFFAFIFLQIVVAWLMGYVIGFGWFRLKSWQSNEASINCPKKTKLLNDFNDYAKQSVSKNQTRIMLVVSLIIAIMFFYPPYQVIAANGVVYNMGYDWLLAPPKKGNITATVNVAMLLTQWAGVLAIGGMTLFLTKTSNRNN